MRIAGVVATEGSVESLRGRMSEADGLFESLLSGEFWVKTVHEYFTNTRMDGAIFAHSWSHSRMVVFAERQAQGLFESLLAEAFRE